MKTLLLILAAVALLATGCTLVPCNHTFPKLEWYWSKEAIDCRHEHELDKQQKPLRMGEPLYNYTNAMFNFSNRELVSGCVVSTNADGKINVLYGGWDFLFYPDGGISSVCQHK